MEQIKNTLVHFNHHSDFDSNSEKIANTSIVFVKDRGEISTHDKIYNFGTLDLSEEPVNLRGLTEEFISASDLGVKIDQDVINKVDTLIISVGINKLENKRRKLILKRTHMNPVIRWEEQSEVFKEGNPQEYEHTFYGEYYTTESVPQPFKRGATISINTLNNTISGSVELL